MCREWIIIGSFSTKSSCLRSKLAEEEVPPPKVEKKGIFGNHTNARGDMTFSIIWDD